MRYLVDYFVLLMCAGVFVGFGVGIATMEPDAPGVPVLSAYMVMALSLCVLAGGHVLLMRREHNGKAPFWLVSITYALVLFAAFFVDVVAIVSLELLGGEDLVPHGLLLTAWALLGGSAVALACAAFAFVFGMHKKVMRRPVWANPWTALKHLIKSARRR